MPQKWRGNLKNSKGGDVPLQGIVLVYRIKRGIASLELGKGAKPF